MTWRAKLELELKDDAAFRRDNLPPAEIHGAEDMSRPSRSPVTSAVRDRGQATRECAVVHQPRHNDTTADAQASDMEYEGQGQSSSKR